MAHNKSHYLAFIQKKWLTSGEHRIAYWMKESNSRDDMDGGTLWLVTSWKRGQARIYSLVAKLTNCEMTKDDPEEYEWPVCLLGSATSQQYATNYANYVLMGLRFASNKPISHKDGIGYALENPRKLSEGDVDLLEEYQRNLAKRPAVFLSHSRKDSRRVGQIERDLDTAGIGVFRDVNSITLGDNWRRAIHRAIENSVVFVYLHSEAAADSPYVREEIEEALRVRKRSSTPVMVTIAERVADVPNDYPFDELKLAEIQALEWSQADARQKVVKDIRRILAEYYVP